MSPHTTKRTFFLLAGILVILILAAIVIPVKPAQTVLEPLPSPNGYDGFVTAGRMLEKFQTNILTQPHPDTLEITQFLLHAQPALDRLQAALKLPCRVPIDFSTPKTADQIQPGATNQARFGILALTLSLKARLAEGNGLFFDAASGSADLLQFSQEIKRGGMVVDELNSIHASVIGIRHLLGLAHKLDARQSRAILGRLKAIELLREPLENTFQREQIRLKMRTSNSSVVTQINSHYYNYQELKNIKKSLIEERKRSESDFQRLKLNLARRAYELEKGKPPASNKDLVPEYLESIQAEP